ncbi:hypothetical protein CLIM01_15222 [Colletotrichum limetticola]|uniref:Secreted protein n=1 Tax=Colletotrichum limetticola TaxID=1209924 RepID=A0ABQ9P730_9PEZI|nr:hypothetical protein CLIM01_15222 [Colletotrichum limetticola]
MPTTSFMVILFKQLLIEVASRWYGCCSTKEPTYVRQLGGSATPCRLPRPASTQRLDKSCSAILYVILA